MKNIKLIFSLLLSATCGIQSTYGQVPPQKTWVTVDNIKDLPIRDQDKLISTNEELQNLIEEFHIISFEQALYTSKKENLLKVYEIQCFCDVLDLEKRIITLEIGGDGNNGHGNNEGNFDPSNPGRSMDVGNGSTLEKDWDDNGFSATLYPNTTTGPEQYVGAQRVKQQLQLSTLQGKSFLDKTIQNKPLRLI